MVSLSHLAAGLLLTAGIGRPSATRYKQSRSSVNRVRQQSLTLRRRQQNRIELYALVNTKPKYLIKQEHSYRKQIARQLGTQYVGGIYRSNYSRSWNLGYGSLNCKQNQSIDHTRLTISRDIWRLILSWPWKWYHLKAWVRFPIRLP